MTSHAHLHEKKNYCISGYKFACHYLIFFSEAFTTHASMLCAVNLVALSLLLPNDQKIACCLCIFLTHSLVYIAKNFLFFFFPFCSFIHSVGRFVWLSFVFHQPKKERKKMPKARKNFFAIVRQNKNLFLRFFFIQQKSNVGVKVEVSEFH
jgi:hypothetical protein